MHYDSKASFAVNVDHKKIFMEETEKDESDARSIKSNSSRLSLSS